MEIIQASMEGLLVAIAVVLICVIGELILDQFF